MRRRIIKIGLFLLFCVFSSAIFAGRVFVYDTNVAHPGLTKAAGELYNQSIGAPKLTAEEINWLAQGAIEEDFPPRWFNHFYDPVHQKGLNSMFDSAKKWAENPENQANFALGDQSWQRAIYEYQRGNKQKAFIALGHVLHLLEDMTVPAHTRNDPHPEGDPYEVWVKENWKVLKGDFIYKNNLSEYFDFLANYSNSGFYSKDTITTQNFPNIDIDGFDLLDSQNGFKKKYFFSNKGTKHYLFWVEAKTEWDVFFKVKDDGAVGGIDDSVIHSNNFSLLSPQAIGAGAGVIKLFFEEAAKAPMARPTKLWQTNLSGYLQEPIGLMVSIAEPLIYSVKSFLTNPSDSAKQWQLVKDVFAIGVALAQETPRQIGATAISAARNMVTETPEIVGDLLQSVLPSAPAPAAPMPAPALDFHPRQSEPVARAEVSVNAAESESNFSEGFLSEPTQANPSVIAPMPLASTPLPVVIAPAVAPAVYNGSVSAGRAAPENPITTLAPVPLVSQSTAPATPSTPLEPLPLPSPPPPLPDTVPPDAPVIIVPNSKTTWTTSTIANLELLLAEDTHYLYFDNKFETVSSSKWSVVAELQEGANIFNFVAADIAENKSATTSITIYKDTTCPLSSISIKTNTVNHKKLTVSWTDDDGLGSGASAYEIEYATSTSGWLPWFNNTTSTTAEFFGEEGDEYQFRARAVDVLGNIGEWSKMAKTMVEIPHVVINEIAWPGTKSSPNDEWLELYNTSDFDADLSGWTLTDGNDLNFVFPTSSSSIFASGGLYLLERTNDQPVANRSARFIYTGNLNNNGERLQLKDSKGRLVDEVDCRSKWFAGNVGYDYDAMERVDFKVSGNIAANWRAALASVRNGLDAKGYVIAGTPGRLNSSQRILSGTISQDTTLSPLRDPYFLGALTVANGAILTINPGTIILGGTGSVLTVQGQLKISGKTESPVIFSALADNDYRGDLTADSKFWDRIEVQSGGQAEIKNASFLYGGAYSSENKEGGVLRVDNGILFAENLEIIKTNQLVGEYFAVKLNNASSTISQSKISYGYKGIKAIGGRLTLSNTEISEMHTDAIWSEDTQTVLDNNRFIHNGWGYTTMYWWQMPTPLYSPVFIRNSLPKAKGDVYQNNTFNAMEVAGQISASGTVDNAGDWPWLIGGWQIMPDVEVKITAGSRLKMMTGEKIKVNGALLAEGAPDANIIFTSWHDDSDGFDLDIFRQEAPNAQGNEWQQIFFDSLATSTLNYTQVRYANTFGEKETQGSVVIKNTPVFLSNSLIQYSRPQGVGLRLQNANNAVIDNLMIKNDYKTPRNIFIDAYGVGILVDGGAPIISSSTIDSFTYGLMTQNQASPRIDNLSLKNVDVPLVSW